MLLNTFLECPDSWSRITCERECAVPAATIRISTPPTKSLRCTTTWELCRRALVIRKTRPRSKSVCKLSNAGFLPPYATVSDQRTTSCGVGPSVAMLRHDTAHKEGLDEMAGADF